jgi:uncharacterized phage protein (TIGR02218 family)
MTDYDVAEKSQSDSLPFELYEFKSTFTSYYLTSDAIPHTRAGHIYVPVPGLRRGELKISTHDEPSNEMTVDVPITQRLVVDCAYQKTPPKLELTIYRMQRNATSYLIYWKGPVSAVSTSGEYATFKIQSTFSQMLQGTIPTVFLQPSCNNVLFDERCKVNPTGNYKYTTVTAIDGLKITVASIDPFPGYWFFGGNIKDISGKEDRTIVAQSDRSLWLNYEFSRLYVGSEVGILAGCDHSFYGNNGCVKFNNRQNYGGFPWVPGESNNVFINGLR